MPELTMETVEELFRPAFDPHAPFRVGPNRKHSGRFVVLLGADDDAFLAPNQDRGWAKEEHAQNFADRLNARWGRRFNDPDPATGICRVCNECHPVSKGAEVR